MLIIKRSLTGVVPHVYSDDPAIDKSHPAYDAAKYRETADVQHLPVREGGQLAVFDLRPLSRDRVLRITSSRPIDGRWTPLQCDEAVAFGLKAVRGLKFDDGQAVELQHERVDGEERLTSKSINEIFTLTLFMELGNRIIELSRLTF